MKRLIRALLGAGVLALLLATCTFTVDETEFVIVERFGDPRRVITEAGLGLKWPPPVDTLVRIDRRVRMLDPEPAEYLTSDKKNVLLSSFLVWRVEDPRQYFVSVADRRGAEARLADIMRSELGTILGRHPLSALVSVEESERDMAGVMEEVTRRTAARAAKNLGIGVSAVRLRRINFPTQNKEAVFRRMEAERQRIAKQYRSEGRESYQKIIAQADLQQAMLVNQALQKAAEIKGAADAEATRIYAEAYSQAPDFYRFLRSLEAYEKIVREHATVVIPSDAKLLEVLRHPPAAEGKPK